MKIEEENQDELDETAEHALDFIINYDKVILKSNLSS